jgi:hypothetical protein
MKGIFKLSAALGGTNNRRFIDTPATRDSAGLSPLRLEASRTEPPTRVKKHMPHQIFEHVRLESTTVK